MEVFFLAASLGSSALSQGGPLSHRASEILQQLAADPQLLEEVTRRHFAGDPAWEGGRGLAESGALVEGGRRLAEGGGSFHSIFFLTCNPAADPDTAHCNYWDWQFFGFWLAVLVVVTLLIEAFLFERLEEAVGGSVLAHHIYQKIVRELALMGLVSFTAIILTNVPVTGHFLKVESEWRFLMLEITHIMIFVMAIMFCLVIFFIYLMVRSTEHKWARIEDPKPEPDPNPNPYQVRNIENEWNAIEDPSSSIGKPEYNPWQSPFELLERLTAHALAEGAAGGTVLPAARAHHATSARHIKHATAMALQTAAHKLHDVSDAAAHILHHEPVGRRRRSAITEGALPQPDAKGSEMHTTPTKRERGDMHVARKHAMHFILQFQFKRAHRLEKMSSFVYSTYLSKSLRTHIIDILEPSRTTWAILFIMGTCCFLLDGIIPLHLESDSSASGDSSGSSSDSNNGKSWTDFWRQDPQKHMDNRSPTTVSIWVHVAWIVLNWLPALGAGVLRLRAKCMYMRHIEEETFQPFAKAWKA